MGTILKPKFDLTSLGNIRKAYDAAFGKSQEVEEVFASNDIRLLEASRHVIVHRAGIADDDFMKTPGSSEIGAAQGQPLPLTGVLVSRMINAGIDAGSKLLAFVDRKVSGVSPPPDTALATVPEGTVTS